MRIYRERSKKAGGIYIPYDPDHTPPTSEEVNAILISLQKKWLGEDIPEDVDWKEEGF